MREVRGEPNDGWYNQPGEERLKRASSHLQPTTYLHQSHKSFFLAGSHIRSGVIFSPGFASLAHLHPTTRETQPVFLELWHQTHPDHLVQLVQLKLLLGLLDHLLRPVQHDLLLLHVPAAPATAHSWTLSGQTTFFIPSPSPNKQSTIIFHTITEIITYLPGLR